VIVDRLTPASAAQMAALHARCFDSGWSEAELTSLILMPSSLTLGVLHDGQVEGFILCRKAVDEAEILTICVDPEKRGTGTGRAILDAAHKALATQSVTRVLLEVSTDNSAARRLYDQAGYSVIGKRPGYYRNGSDALMLEKSLSGRGQA